MITHELIGDFGCDRAIMLIREDREIVDSQVNKLAHKVGKEF